MRRPLTVAAFPHTVRDNPYVDLLHRELGRQGVRVAPDPDLSVRWLLQNRRQVDVLHFHWPHLYYHPDGQENGAKYYERLYRFCLRVLTSRLLGYRLVWTVHNLLPHDSRYFAHDLVARNLLARLTRLAVHGESAKHLFRTKFHVNRPITVVPHGSYVGAYPNETTREEARARLRLPKGSRVYLCFGNIKPYKGIPGLLEIFQRFKGEQNILLVAGKPSHQALLERIRARQQADDRIRLHARYIPDEEIQHFFKASDFVVLPYSEILTSGVAILAQSFGRFIVAPDKGCMRDLIPDRTGLLFRNGSAGLLRALEETERLDPANCEKLALEAAAQLTWESIARRYRQLYAA